MKKNTIIFDFDGTIADSFAVILSIFNELSGLKRNVSNEEITRLRSMSLSKAVGEFNLPRWRIIYMLLRGRIMMKSRIDEVKIFEGVSDVLKQLHNSDCEIYIVSSNSTNNVRNFLVKQNLDEYFHKIYGGVGIFGKARVIKRIMKYNGLPSKNCIYVGDEMRDIEASKAAKVKSIAVSWGFNAPKLLQEHKPDALVESPQQLADVITAWNG
jgi:phosphoglycolate phosphatase